jgi:2-dehydro-3-deoxyphosphogluconate aldolase/(4S)-4-hydroxy-2-oxoglutarate aldolase
MHSRASIVKQLCDAGVVAVLRADSKAQLMDVTRALLAGGVNAIEVTMSTPDAIAGIETLATKHGDSIILGVGTVLDAETARDAVAAGARFVVSPVFIPAILEAAHAADCPCVPGAFTPTEILAAHNAGADVVKVFPSTALGPGYFRDILAPLPFLKLMPTGGVDASNVAQWLKAGAVCVGAGSALVPKDAARKGDWNAITKLADGFIRAAREARA